MRAKIPCVRRSLDETRLTLWMPYREGNREWLHESLGARIRPEWNKTAKRWELARSHLRAVVLALAERFGTVDVYLEFSTQERCDVRCRDARGDDCTCSCLGDNHGGAAYWKDWQEVGETTLIAQNRQQRHFRVARSRSKMIVS